MKVQNKKKILIVTPYFYPEGGGQEHYAYQVAKNCPDYEFQVATLSKKKSKQNLLNNIKVHRYKANLIISNTPINFLFLFKLIKLIKQEKFDIIHSHTPVPFAVDIAALASVITRTPLVVTYHSAKLLKDKFFIDLIIRSYLIIEKLTLKIAQKVIFVSPHILKESRMKKYNNKSSIIFPGVDMDKFKFKKYLPGYNLFFICPLKKSYTGKGLDLLLKALVEVKKDNSNFILNIAGVKGDAYKDYFSLVRKLGLDKNIVFLGHLDQSQMIKQYQENQIIIIASKPGAEGTPTVLFEAGSVGRPIIASRASGVPYIITDNHNGLLFSPNSFKELAEKIVYLLQNQEISAKIGEEAYLGIQKYSWKKIAYKHKSIYDEILA